MKVPRNVKTSSKNQLVAVKIREKPLKKTWRDEWGCATDEGIGSKGQLLRSGIVGKQLPSSLSLITSSSGAGLLNFLLHTNLFTCCLRNGWRQNFFERLIDSTKRRPRGGGSEEYSTPHFPAITSCFCSKQRQVKSN